ncbi:response regulator transcription factor [Stenotrophomonas sp.]|uniref:response regulator transcription factor n=1 Tax=Stenotrophomonas sp. TaxID=69392 RepID=UPI00374D444E
MNVLIIDDDPQIVSFLTRLVTRMLPDCTVRSATNGIQGVQLALEHRATLQLIILDARMPSLDGQLVAAFLRCACPTVPIVPLSGDPRTASTFTALGCLPSLTKGSPTALYEQAIAHAMETIVPASTITPLHRAMAEQVAQILATGDAGQVVVERQTLQRLTTSLEGLVRRTTDPNRDLSRSIKELRRIM